MFARSPVVRGRATRHAAWKLVTNDQQWARFVEDVPSGEPPVLARDDFTAWAEAYLESDPAARSRSPPAVKTPTGPLVEILRAWHGELAWEPGDVQAPVAIIRGAWDGLVTDQDARWLFERLASSTDRRDVKIGRGTRLMHLEVTRTALWRESIAFLLGDDFKTQATTTIGEHRVQDHQEAKDLPGYNPGSVALVEPLHGLTFARLHLACMQMLSRPPWLRQRRVYMAASPSAR
jgi:hypothetical protein